MIEFEWDEAKNRANRKKHGIDFNDAIRVFDDPFYVSVPERVQDGEQRWQTFGLVKGVLLLMVAHTVRGESDEGKSIEVFRIITARTATARERRQYENENC